MKIKINIKKILLCFSFVLLCTFVKSQGLENIVVEKYYVANAADAAGSVGTLPVGSVTYRIYVDMLPGYKLQNVYGTATHPLKLTTTTTFFNNEDYGSVTGTVSNTNLGKNTVMLDSWVSVGGAGAAKYGVLKSADTDGSIAHTLLQNNVPAMGIPLTSEDGMMPGTPKTPDFLGDAGTALSILGATSQAGNSVVISGGAWYKLGGVSGIDSATTNRILIAQITTDGIFHYELNIQIGTPVSGVSENYVTSNPVSGELTLASLKGTLGTPNVLPTVSITAPVTGATPKTGDIVVVTANASDLWGTDSTAGSVTSVQFFDGATLIGTIANPGPYTVNWTAGSIGAHTLTAKATDNEGGQTTSAAVFVSVLANVLPTVTISTDSLSPVNQGSVVTITAAPADADGTISKVDFYNGTTLMGTRLSAPWTQVWTTTASGIFTLTAKATDNNNGIATSAPILFTVKDTSGAAYEVRSDSIACSEGLFYVPVYKINTALNNGTGFDATMKFDGSKVIPTGLVIVNSELITDSLWTSYNVHVSNDSMNISIYLNSSAPAGTTFDGLGKLFSVEFARTPSFAAIDTVTFDVPFMMESYDSATAIRIVKSGDYSSYKETNFTGNLKFWSSNAPIVYDASNPTTHLITDIYGNLHPATNAVQPNTLGVFNYDITNGDTISIKKDINDTTTVMPVINGYDAYFVQKVLVNDPNYIPSVYQIIAMDVNMDHVVSAGDLSQLNQRTVKTIGEFTQVWNYSTAVPSKDWLFVPQTLVQTDLSYRRSNTYPLSDGVGYSKFKVPSVPLSLALPYVDTTSTCPELGTETYKGILLGDVNGSYATVNPSNMKESVNKVIFNLSNATVSGNFIDVPVSILSNVDVNAFDFSAKLNNLSFVSVADNTNSLNMLTNVAADNTLLFTSSSLTNYVESPVTVRFSSSNGTISSADLANMNAYVNGDAAEVLFSATGINENISNQVVNVYPNPANDVLNVLVSENATVQLLDLSGKQVLSTINAFANQIQVMDVKNLSEGVYIMKISNEKSLSIKKVVLSK
jgi:hypothetical protein